jgi:hypothetical protein
MVKAPTAMAMAPPTPVPNRATNGTRRARADSPTDASIHTLNLKGLCHPGSLPAVVLRVVLQVVPPHSVLMALVMSGSDPPRVAMATNVASFMMRPD